MNVQSRIELPRGLSIDAFFGWCAQRDERYELVEGAARLQPWVKRNHSRIASNASFLLQTLLDRDLYDIHQGDFAIATGPSTIRYADVLVELAGGAGHARIAEAALLVIEILSPSTASDDPGAKREEYQRLASLHSCIVLSQDERLAAVRTRRSDRSWPDEPVKIDCGTIPLAHFSIDLPMDGLYRGLSLE